MKNTLIGKNMKDLKTKEQIMIKTLIQERKKVLEEICILEINKGIAHRQVIQATADSKKEQKLARITNRLKSLKEALVYMESRLTDLIEEDTK